VDGTETATAGDAELSGKGRGRRARKVAPRSSQAVWEPGPARVDPLQVLAEQDGARVPELVPVRYGRMLVSPFTFYRGAAAIMAADLAAAPDSGLTVQLCGDAHLSNFGVFQAPDRRLVFDINDFDETLPGPFEWDVKRLAASVAIGARDRGFSAAEGEAAVLAAVASYRDAMAEFATMGELDVWYARLDVAEKKRVSVHEAGHAVVARFSERAEPPHRISIIPRGMSLGATHQRPGLDRHLMDEGVGFRLRDPKPSDSYVEQEVKLGCVEGLEPFLRYTASAARPRFFPC